VTDLIKPIVNIIRNAVSSYKQESTPVFSIKYSYIPSVFLSFTKVFILAASRSGKQTNVSRLPLDFVLTADQPRPPLLL
jgi:hypothetical protein